MLVNAGSINLMSTLTDENIPDEEIDLSYITAT